MILICHATSSLAHGALVPIPIFPHDPIRIDSTLFLLNTRSTLSVVQRKLVQAIVPLLPVTIQAPAIEPGSTQLARPEASEESTFPAHGEPPVIFNCPAISSFAHGVIVPIPILAPSS